MGTPLIYNFKSKNGNHYIYDAANNYTYCVDEVDIHIVKNFKQKSLDELKSFLSPQFTTKEIEQSFQKVALWIEQEKAFYPHWTKDNKSIMLSEEEYYKKMKNVYQLQLEITQKCNLRCKYCVYSGIYKDHRIHSNTSMTWDIAKRSIDYFIELLNSHERTTTENHNVISFYGGEPLIGFKLIKKCVEYVKKIKCEENIFFNMTTNGTLLTEEIIKFLIKHEFILLISLDGPNQEHDKHRIFKDGKKSFDHVYKNIKKIRQIDKNFYNLHVRFNAVFSPLTDLYKVIDFFASRSKYIYKKILKIDPIVIKNNLFYDNISIETKENHKLQKNKLLKDYIYYKSFNKKSPYIVPLERTMGEMYDIFSNRFYKNISDIVVNGGSCIPGTSRIYVAGNGSFHTCEKINFHFPIGDCWNGIEYNKVKQIYEAYLKKICYNCHNCIYVQNCSVCIATVADKGYFDNHGICENLRQQFKNFLHIYYSILEDNPSAFKKNDFNINVVL